MPAQLLNQAQANPGHVFAVIVQGRAESSDDVAFDVAEERATSSGGGKGTKKLFATISGVSAELTGEQILKLAERNDILAITLDAPVVMTGGMLPPSPLAPPTIDGVAQDGQTLTATDGVWSGTVPIEYVRRWQRCDALGSVCVDIAGSTGAVYAAGPADVGSTLRVAVTGTNPVGSDTAVSDPTAVVAAASVGPLPPVNLSPPVISGTATEGLTLTASEGTWGGSFPVAYSYAWQRCDATGAGCVGAAGATGAGYVLTSADVGSTLRVVVTATDSGGSTSSTSLQSAVVAAAPRPPAASAPPAVSGDARDGATLTAAPGVWVASGAFSQDYSWERCGAGYDQAVLTDAPAGYWRLDGTAADASGHGLNGAASGTVSQVDGATSNSTAIGFGANGGIDVPNATIGAAFTLEAWVRVDRAQQDKGLLGRWRYADGGGALLWIDTQGHYGLAVGRQPSTYLTTTVAPQPGRWEHVVGTWDGTVLRVFVNGVEAGSQPFAGDIGSTLRDFEIGKYGDPAQHLEGAVDEAALYSRALGAADVSRHYAAGCHAIAGATGGSYTIGTADLGSQLRVRVTATNEAGSGIAVSNATATVQGAAPVSTSAPAVSGSALETQTLTASPGTWTGTAPIAFSYRWERCAAAGATCLEVVGAVGETYMLSATDVGAKLRAVVTATNASGSSEAASAPSDLVLAAAPAATAAPSVTGTGVAGSTLTASQGTWSGVQPIAFSYRWQRCDTAGLCTDLTGATSASYTLTAVDVGATVKVIVTATNAAGSSDAVSDATAPITGVAPTSDSAPQVSGSAMETQTLTASEGTWGGTQPIDHTYRWQRCDSAGACVEIAGATGATYTLTAADVGSRIKVVVSATNVAGSSQAVSGATALVAAAAPVSLTDPQVSGAAIDQQTVTASPGTWSGIEPIAFSYRWQRCVGTGPCEEIVGALGPTYLLSAADVGSMLRVVVSATNAAGSSEASSQKTAPVGGVAPSSVAAPQVSGTAIETQTLTASEGTWSGTQPIAHSYRWQRCDAAGGCVDIAAATGSTYALTAADVGTKVKVVVSATNMAGSSEAVSATTAQVLSAAPVSLSAPSVTGEALETQTLSASTGTWSGLEPITFSYRWQRCDAAGACVDIAGGTNATYTLTAADVGATVKAVVSASNAAGSSEAPSAATALVLAAAPVVKAPPSVSGVAEDGSTLVAATGTWSGVEPTLSVRWERCDVNGASCIAIVGAESASYVLGEADVAATVRAVVTATNAAGSDSAASAPSPVVSDSFTALQQWPSVVGAESSWASAKANVGVPTIALVDSGIEAGRADFGGRVAYQETLTTQTPNSPGDGRGHGTLVASIAAGEGAGYAGVAPGARLVSLDVLDDSGRGRTSDVIAAADWIYRNKDAYSVRVANFSVQAGAPTSFRLDPLNRAVQKLWFSGVVVVAAAGNYATDGLKSDVPFPPGNDPFIITVGAVDTAGTVAPSDDFTAPWSAWGFTPDGFAKPDVSAPGRYMVGAVPQDSTLVAERPTNVVAPGYMQLSGTSFATPIVAGAAAYLLGQHPTWTPDQVKGALMHESTTLPAATRKSFGIGEIDIARAASNASPPNPNLALNRFLVEDPAGGLEPVFDDAGWVAAVEADPAAWGSEAWGVEAWGVEAWGVEAWGVEAWGVTYWEPVPSWSTPITTSTTDGPPTSALNNANSDWLPTGGYWLMPGG